MNVANALIRSPSGFGRRLVWFSYADCLEPDVAAEDRWAEDSLRMACRGVA